MTNPSFAARSQVVFRNYLQRNLAQATLISDLTSLSFVASHPYFIILQRQVYFPCNKTIL